MAKHQYRVSGIVEAFQMTRARRESNVDWPQWLHDAWNKDPAELGALFVNAKDRAGRSIRLNTYKSPNQDVAWGDFIVRNKTGYLAIIEAESFARHYEPVH